MEEEVLFLYGKKIEEVKGEEVETALWLRRLGSTKLNMEYNTKYKKLILELVLDAAGCKVRPAPTYLFNCVFIYFHYILINN